MTRKDEVRRELLLRHLRRVCLPLPEASETVKWGNPTFVAGRKLFAVLDRYDGTWMIAFRAADPLRSVLLERADIIPAPYSAKYGWVCFKAEGRVDWKEVGGWVRGSYRTVALKRMLAALEKEPS